MERNREARRGGMAAVSGGGLQRRRQRSGSFRDSPEDGTVEAPEMSRLRERASKRDRDRERDRLSRNRSRRGERTLHGSGREDGDDSSEESVDEELEDEEEDDSTMTLRPPHPPPASSPAASSAPSAQGTHIRRSLPAVAATVKPLRPPPPVWKVADEMIGVSVPRKARSASGKRLLDSWASGGGAEPIHRQASTSPARPNTSSSVPARKKMKPVGGAMQQTLQKSLTPPSVAQEDIEFEVAEVLFGMTRQVHGTAKPENPKIDSKDANGCISEVRSGASSPPSQSSAQPQRNHFSNQGTIAPKRKRPRPIKFDDESAMSPPSSTALPTASMASAMKFESDERQTVKAEDDSSLRSEKNTLSTAVENSRSQPDHAVSQAGDSSIDARQNLGAKRESNRSVEKKVLAAEPDGRNQTPAEVKLEDVPSQQNLDVKSDPAPEKPREEKFSIDLMFPPPGKLSPEREDDVPFVRPQHPEMELVSKICSSGREVEMTDAKLAPVEIRLEERKEKPVAEEHDLAKQNDGKESVLDLQLAMEKLKREVPGGSKEQPSQKQHSRATTSAKAESKHEKAVPPVASVSMPLPVPVSGWPGNLPPFGYMAQIPSLQPVIPMDTITGSSKTLQPINLIPPQRPKRCATHCYIAQTIRYHQHLAKMNAFWPAAASTMQLYGPKSCNLNALPTSEAAAVLRNPLQGNLAGRNPISLQDKSGSPIITGYMGHSTGGKGSVANNLLTEAAQRKQFMLQQAPQPSMANNILGPALIFPLNQHHTSVASPSRPAAPKSTSVVGNAAPSSSAPANPVVANSGMGGPTTAVNFNYTTLPPNEYMAILQNSGYPFPIPPQVGAASYRGTSPAQAIPFYGGPFYSSQMINPSQLQQKQAPPQQPPQSQPLLHNTSTSSGSSSSQRHPQHSRRVVPGGLPASSGGSSHSFPIPKQGQHLPESAWEDSPLITDGRASQGQKSIYGHNFALPIHPQNFALISPALGSGGGSQDDKQQVAQRPGIKVELTPSQAYAMSFASLTGASISGCPAAPLGLDFSAMAQSHALFQSLPEGARHGYQMVTSTQVAQHHKKAHHPEDGKSVGESVTATIANEGERKMMASSKVSVSGPQQSLNFSRPDNEAPVSSILSNNIMDSSSRTLNLIPAISNGVRTPNQAASATPTTTATATAVVSSPNSEQLQQQQQMQLSHQLTTRPKSSAASSNASVYMDRLSASSTVAKYQTLSGFPQPAVQSSGSPSQSPQWKTASRSVGMTVTSPAAPYPSLKHQLPQQQGRVSLQSPSPAHQTQISFGVNSSKMAVGTTGQPSMPSLSSAASTVVGSFPTSVNKSTGSGSPQASLNGKSVSTTLPLPQQASDKNSQSSSSLKPSSVSKRNLPSILGHPHVTPTQSLSSKQQQQQSQSLSQQKRQHPQPQFFFSSAYMPSQSIQSNASAATAAYYQRQQSELHPQQHNSNPASVGVLSLCSSALTLSPAPATNDPAKAMAAAANMKGLAAPGLLQHPSHPASAGQYPLIPAGAAGFPYIHALPSVSVKPSEQKPAAGK